MRIAVLTNGSENEGGHFQYRTILETWKFHASDLFYSNAKFRSVCYEIQYHYSFEPIPNTEFDVLHFLCWAPIQRVLYWMAIAKHFLGLRRQGRKYCPVTFIGLFIYFSTLNVPITAVYIVFLAFKTHQLTPLDFNQDGDEEGWSRWRGLVSNQLKRH